jgi:large subunit ribosomal protein L16
MLQPCNRKFKKEFKGRMASITYKGTDFTSGQYALKAMESGKITAKQIESVRKVLSRYLKKIKTMKTIIRIFPYKPITKKPAEVRMGGGKGSVEYWVAVAEAGRMLFEIECESNYDVVLEALRQAQYKLPIKTKIVERLI